MSSASYLLRPRHISTRTPELESCSTHINTSELPVRARPELRPSSSELAQPCCATLTGTLTRAQSFALKFEGVEALALSPPRQSVSVPTESPAARPECAAQRPLAAGGRAQTTKTRDELHVAGVTFRTTPNGLQGSPATF